MNTQNLDSDINSKEQTATGASSAAGTLSLESDHASNNWYALDADEVLNILHVDGDGLDEANAAQRRVKYGLNQLTMHKSQSIIMRFLRQFHNVLIYILLLSAVIALAMQRWIDMAVILGVIILNAIFGFIQEGKAEKALAAIRQMLAPMAKVVRKGKRMVILASLLVPGDIVIVERGDKVPADLRLIKIRGLQIQEAILTGEAAAVEKTITAVAESASLAERFSLLYSGTIVTNGSGVGVVIATGPNTEIGKISTILSNVEAPTTPLLQQMNRFGYWLTGAILLLGAITFLIGAVVWDDHSPNMFMAIVGLIVAAVPEGLPPILTIILAIGVTRMAKRHAIIRQLPAVETMGAVTTICSDKTGTLTCNELSVEDLVTTKNDYDITDDEVYMTSKSGQKQKIKLEDRHDFRQALLAGILCNDAEVRHIDGNKAEAYGDPLDQALLVLAHKAKMDWILLKKAHPRHDLIPYESEHKFMATLHHDHIQDKTFIYVKGAPENILSMCVAQQVDGEAELLDSDYWYEEMNKLARRGEKVLAIAYKEVIVNQQTLQFSDIEKLTAVALFGFIDPPREGVVEAVAECHAAGIKVKMITGDYALTATAIAKSIGIVGDIAKTERVEDGTDELIRVLTGPQIDAMDDEMLACEVLAVDIYARASPEHKLRLVKALQDNGQVVAMTGDGVNDAPALRQADIGIAMGEKGTEIAKEAAAMVLTDDNFATIVHAVEEGRTIYENLKKTIIYILPTSIAQAFTIVVAIFLGWQPPITAVQILWVNMITAVTLSLALGFEPPASDVMLRAPRLKNTPLLSGFLIWRVAFVSILLVAAVFVASLIERIIGADLVTTRTVAVNMIVVGEIFYLLNCRHLVRSVLNREALLGSKPIMIAIAAVLFLQAMFTYLPMMQHFFGTANIDAMQWLRISVIAGIIFIAIELEKVVIRFYKHATVKSKS